ncbi:AAA family ATPase [Cryobacterium sp. PH31-AA6]|uniref:AAA family ATPase n=1 Tax=Cryobacterium sp. PH31-AA6 TaxID=3046205 RepID=UPI0024BAB1C5|nr:AAA family ATPase [Cryobacterium sp. PH31-AA6]MDJ0322469.1 AAA family ATPase [Cryobacterium sp. PH31-AA6]
MSSLTNYGQAIASTTIALQQLLTSPPVGLQATARAPGEARTGVTGASVNLFLYSDSLISYREASAQHGPSRVIAELHYLVNAFPDDESDLDSGSHRAFGAARAAIERHPVLTVPVGAADSIQVWLTPSPLTTEVLTALWLASREPLRLSFGVMASFTLDAAERVALVGTVHDVVQLAGAGAIAVFSGSDAAAKAVAAESVAHELGKPLVTVPLDSIVGRDMGETERNLSGLFDQAEHRGAVLLIDEAEALFGVRPEVLDVEDPYAEIDVAQLLDRLGTAPSVVIIALRDSAGDELADRTRVEVRFPSTDGAESAEVG